MVAIGGVGGSGTRLVANLLIHSGYNLGEKLNNQNDNLYFTLLFKRPEILTMSTDEFSQYLKIFMATYSGDCSLQNRDILIQQAQMSHPVAWYQSVVISLLSHLDTPVEYKPLLCGWKEPNTHIILDRLYQSIPKFKYIHVIRNGLDMAFSTNQRQALLWGKWLLGEETTDPTPSYLLKYWCAAHKRVINIVTQLNLTESFFLLDYDRLITTPMPVLHELFSFLNLPVTENHLNELSQLILPSTSAGRFKSHDLCIFDPVDIDYVAALGFSVH